MNRRVLLWMFALCSYGGMLFSQEVQESKAELPPPRTHYLGREIARTMTFHGAPWLTRPERERVENTQALLEQLRIRPGMMVCDLGCGNGYYTLRIARRLQEVESAVLEFAEQESAEQESDKEGANLPGRVLAVDIQQEMLDLLAQRCRGAGLEERIVPILGGLVDPKLPAGKVDLLLLADVYHEFSHPVLMLAAIRNSLAKDGLVALVEFREEDPKVPIKRRHKMSKRQARKEFEANGFRLVREYDELPWQHLMFFGRAEVEREP